MQFILLYAYDLFSRSPATGREPSRSVSSIRSGPSGSSSANRTPSGSVSSKKPEVSDALRKYSLDNVLGGISTKQTMTLGSTLKEEEAEMAVGLGEVSFLGYVCLVQQQKFTV